MPQTPTSPTAPAPSLWSDWTEATDEQRAHFHIEVSHGAWSRTCSGCGEGDFLERKHKPSTGGAELRGRGFPVLPQVFPEGEARRHFRTPPHRVHTCFKPGIGRRI